MWLSMRHIAMKNERVLWLTLKVCSKGGPDPILGLLPGGILVPKLLLVDLSTVKDNVKYRRSIINCGDSKINTFVNGLQTKCTSLKSTPARSAGRSNSALLGKRACWDDDEGPACCTA